MHACLRMGWFQLQGSLSIQLYFSFRPPTFKEGKIWPEGLSERIFRSVNFECANKLSYYTRHTSKPGPDSDPDSDSKKIRTREKPGPGLEKNPDSCLTKPGLDF